MERKHQTETKLISLRSTSRYYHDFDTTSIFVDEGKASIELRLTRNKGERRAARSLRQCLPIFFEIIF